jgi:hypothetical protein
MTSKSQKDFAKSHFMTRKITLILTFFLFLNALVTADEKVYADIAGYKNARVKKIEVNSVRIMHDKGFADVPISAISEEIRKELKLLLPSEIEPKQIKKSEIEESLKSLRTPDASFEVMKGKVFQVISGVDVLVKLDGAEGNLIHVSTFTKKMFEGDIFVETVKFSGAYQYTSVIGGNKKIRSYVSLGPGMEIPTSPHCLAIEQKCAEIFKSINSDVITTDNKNKLQPIIDYARSQVALLKKSGTSDEKIQRAIKCFESLN